ncbi:MAG: DUF4339 domain-containing protein [Verrucomicrobiota bacterium]|nr:DUF4339 domain-containing protein [Verrucomicrobiota bacterium]
MAEEWFVRVEGKEYGPVDLDTLREWQADGRVIPQNEVRPAGGDWIFAGAVPELFPPPPLPLRDAQYLRPRSFREILSDTFRLYARGFPQFFALGLLVGIPALGFQISMMFTGTSGSADSVSLTSRLAAGAVVLCLLLLIALWPLYLAAMQLAVADLTAGRAIRIGNLLRRARERWRLVAKLCLFVYSSFLFWTALPLLAVGLVASSPSIPSVLLALVALAFQVYMVGRLFINFMFWQQTSVIDGEETLESLRASQELARSGRHEPWTERPLYRGTALASIWLVLLVALAVALEVPVLLWRLRGVGSMEGAVALMDTLVKNPPADALNVVSYAVSSLANAALHPLLGIAFVVLYFDAKARQ